METLLWLLSWLCVAAVLIIAGHSVYSLAYNRGAESRRQDVADLLQQVEEWRTKYEKLSQAFDVQTEAWQGVVERMQRSLTMQIRLNESLPKSIDDD